MSWSWRNYHCSNLIILDLRSELLSLIFNYHQLTLPCKFKIKPLDSNYFFRNNNTGKIEVGLVEEIYEDQDNTDKLERLKSASKAPYLLSIGFIRDETEDVVAYDADDFEIQCFD